MLNNKKILLGAVDVATIIVTRYLFQIRNEYIVFGFIFISSIYLVFRSYNHLSTYGFKNNYIEAVSIFVALSFNLFIIGFLCLLFFSFKSGFAP